MKRVLPSIALLCLFAATAQAQYQPQCLTPTGQSVVTVFMNWLYGYFQTTPSQQITDFAMLLADRQCQSQLFLDNLRATLPIHVEAASYSASSTPWNKEVVNGQTDIGIASGIATASVDYNLAMSAGDYLFTVSMATSAPGVRFHLESPPGTVISTSPGVLTTSWTDFALFSVRQPLHLPAGTVVLRIVQETCCFNLRWFVLQKF